MNADITRLMPNTVHGPVPCVLLRPRAHRVHTT